MKKLFTILLLELFLTIPLFAQTEITYKCNDIIKTIFDEEEGKVYTFLKENLIISEEDETFFEITLMQPTRDGNKSLIFVIEIKEVETIDPFCPKDVINILFRDRTTINLSSDNSEYHKHFALYFGPDNIFGKEKELQMLQTKEIKTIKIYTHSGKYIERNFSTEQSKIFMKAVNCLSKK